MGGSRSKRKNKLVETYKTNANTIILLKNIYIHIYLYDKYRKKKERKKYVVSFFFSGVAYLQNVMRNDDREDAGETHADRCVTFAIS